jgi:hypothetical protein
MIGAIALKGVIALINLLGSTFQAYSQVSLKDIRNWFTHSCYCISPI